MPRRGKGEGSIFQRKDGRWAAFVTVGYGPDGKQQKRWVYGRTRREVAEKLARLLPKAGYGVIQPSRLRLGEWLERWAAEHVRTHNIRPSTAAKYEEFDTPTAKARGILGLTTAPGTGVLRGDARHFNRLLKRDFPCAPR